MSSNSSKYESPDINELMGVGEEPEDISVSAGATFQEKEWYEYIIYSDSAVCSYRLSDDSRLVFYDPYTYTNAMLMDVQFDATTTEFDTMSQYSITTTSTKTISTCESSTFTNSTAEQTSGRDKTGTKVENGGYTKTTYNHEQNVFTTGTKSDETQYNYTLMENFSVSATEKAVIGLNPSGELSMTQGSNYQWMTDKVTNKTIYSDDYKTTTKYSGDQKLDDYTYSETTGWTELSARVTKTIGSANTINHSWTESDSVSVTKVYAATHFASDGVTPLPWAIVHYSVKMPMKCSLQIRSEGEWITVSTQYCLMTTVQGTCRAWMQNGQVYYEDWGNGEPVVATDFWAQFMTKEQLISAYADKLYPVGGDS